MNNTSQKIHFKEFDKVIGYEDIKQELYKICDALSNPDKYARLGVIAPRGVLFCGEPGLGKTLMANCLIKSVDRKIFVCRKDASNGKFVDSIKNTFEEAQKNTPSIILLDDMDKFANEDLHHRNADEYVTIQSCIDNIKNKDVFVVATVNDLLALPSSLTRAGRFDKILEIPRPKGQDAVKIVEFYLSQKNYVSDINAEEIAKILDGRSCAELETVVNEAGIYAGWEDKEKIDMDDMIKACMRVIFDAPESKTEQQNAYIDHIAYHEAGHVVVSEILEPNSVNLVSINKTTGSSSGITSQEQSKDYWYNLEYMKNRVLCLLAGRAATEIQFGICDVGSSRDIDRALAIIERMVTQYNVAGFNKTTFTNRLSEHFLQRKEEEIFSQIDNYYRKARKILIENKEFLDKLAQEILEKKTILRKDIQAIKSTCKIVDVNIKYDYKY